MNAAFYDSFKEGNKGAAMGKVAGGMNPQAPVIDMEMGHTIQLYMNMMAYIKQELGEIAGVSAARQGQIHQRQAVGNTEMEMNQSSHITEYWFLEHDQVKIRVLECLLETAKYAWKDTKNKKIQYILDDGASMLLNLDGEQFNECEYGLLITDGSGSHELLQTMKQLAHAGIQTGIINFSQLIDIYSTDSISAIRRKIERAEEEKKQMDAQKEKQQIEVQNKQIDAAAQEAERAREFVREEWDREDDRNTEDNETKIQLERMRQDNETSRYYEEVDTGTDSVSLEKLSQDAKKIDNDYKAKLRAQKETERKNKKAEELKEKELRIKKATSNKPANK
jgi:hypothetical protein